MTHAELVKLAERWLRKSPNPHPIVLADVRVNAVGEQPDAIGWRSYGVSTLIECKASRADFLRDEAKRHRRFPDTGMGAFRYYCAPAGILSLADLPARWGLLTPSGRGGLTIAYQATPFAEYAWRDETTLLVSALRRATEGWGRRIFGDDAPVLVDGDPHPTATATIKSLREQYIADQRTIRDLTMQLEALRKDGAA